jgi:hypothetical protein
LSEFFPARHGGVLQEKRRVINLEFRIQPETLFGHQRGYDLVAIKLPASLIGVRSPAFSRKICEQFALLGALYRT